jgi:hypothetical protein
MRFGTPFQRPLVAESFEPIAPGPTIVGGTTFCTGREPLGVEVTGSSREPGETRSGAAGVAGGVGALA